MTPKAESSILKGVIKQAKSILVVPLVAGSMCSTTLLSNGQYILAIKCTLASGVSTIILVTTVYVVDRILDIKS